MPYVTNQSMQMRCRKRQWFMERRMISNFMALLPVHFCVVCPRYRMRTKKQWPYKKNYCLNINVKLITCLRTQNPLSKHRGPNWTFVILYSGRPHNCKTAHFTSWKERERLRNVQKKRKMNVRSVKHNCFSTSNMQICNVLVAVVVALAQATYYAWLSCTLLLGTLKCHFWLTVAKRAKQL